jgi:glucose-6-phosphate 1-dehydrogenase
MRQEVQTHHLFQPETWQSFSQSLYFVGGDLSAAATETYTTLRDAIEEIRSRHQIPDHVLLYLSTPPSLYEDIIQKSAEASLLTHSQGWRRVICEKPFGQDEASARDLDWHLRDRLDESQIYRIDHYLGKETVQNLLAVRFANPGFEAMWNRDYIDHVQITVAEDEGIGSRAGYYDKTGVVRDMVQNHLLQLLCLTAMEPPAAYDATALRDQTVSVLQAVRPIDVKADCVLGQYGRGDHGSLRAYRDEDNVPDTSTTATFAALKLTLDNWRWAGVPFYLRTGKRLPRSVAEVTLQFKPMSHPIFPVVGDEPVPGNRLTFCLKPDEGMRHTFLAKQPGPGFCVQPVTMPLYYDKVFGLETLPSAYEWLLLDAMHGDQTLFARSDWIYAAWSIVDPLVTRWEAMPPRDLPNYAAATWGPKAAAALIEQEGRAWHVT